MTLAGKLRYFALDEDGNLHEVWRSCHHLKNEATIYRRPPYGYEECRVCRTSRANESRKRKRRARG
jgi:hypothetical protein